MDYAAAWTAGCRHCELHATAQTCGIRVRRCTISPALLERITERGRFSLIDLYLRLAGEGAHIAAFDIGRARWLEIGSPERLAEARAAYDKP
jgi:hypothetical protein